MKRIIVLFAITLLAALAHAGGAVSKIFNAPTTGKVTAVTQGRLDLRSDGGVVAQANVGSTQSSNVNIGQTVWLHSNKVVYVDFPIETERKDQVGGGDYMSTKVKLSNTGLLTATTRTWTTACADGFTGGVRVILMKKDGNELHITKLRKYGVNGECVPSSPSDRKESWDENIPLDKVNEAAKLAIVHIKKPTDRIDDFLARAKEVAEILKTASEAYSNVAGAGGKPAAGSAQTSPTTPPR